ncbi:hypothetical protein GE09DRAFT_782868 [Coniochaeta sp. 2T2.1]|nr:hypothetical protein GE09DRAFT_782868 [Coniochaeta sp. 2T2.1]
MVRPRDCSAPKSPAATCLGRMGQAHEVAKMLCFMMTDDASYVTGGPSALIPITTFPVKRAESRFQHIGLWMGDTLRAEAAQGSNNILFLGRRRKSSGTGSHITGKGREVQSLTPLLEICDRHTSSLFQHNDMST